MLLQQLLVAFNGRPATTAAVGAIADSSDVTTLTKPIVALVAAKSKTAGERTESPACRSQNKHGLNCSSLGRKRVPVSWGAGLIKLCILPDSCTPRHCGMKMQAVTIAVTKLLPSCCCCCCYCCYRHRQTTASPEHAAIREDASAATTATATRKDALTL